MIIEECIVEDASQCVEDFAGTVEVATVEEEGIESAPAEKQSEPLVADQVNPTPEAISELDIDDILAASIGEEERRRRSILGE